MIKLILVVLGYIGAFLISAWFLGWIFQRDYDYEKEINRK